MNRKEFAKILEKKVEVKIKENTLIWNQAELERKKFFEDYSVEKIKEMSLDEYVIGQGGNNRSFCYRISRELKVLGNIGNLWPKTFGVYFNKNRGYDCTKKFGSDICDVDNAFINVKNSIIELIDDNITLVRAKKNKLSTNLKGKILFIYHPDKFLNIYSKEHLLHFAEKLEVDISSKHELDIQNDLIEYRDSFKILNGKTQLLFDRIIYDEFGAPKKIIEKKME